MPSSPKQPRPARQAVLILSHADAHLEVFCDAEVDVKIMIDGMEEDQ